MNNSAFPTEADMLDPIARGLHAVLGSRQRHEPEVLFEFDVSEGVADIVALQFNGEAVARREFACLGPVVDRLSVQTLVALRNGPLALADLARAAGLSSGYLRRVVLPRLGDEGWVRKTPDRGWESPVVHRPLARWILAVEAKRRDWRTAFWQADRYRRFANRTVVILDAAANIDAARHARGQFAEIGLATVTAETGVIQALHLPGWRTASSATDFALAGERAWEMHLTGARTRSLRPVFGRQLLATGGGDPRLLGAGERSHPPVLVPVHSSM